MKDGTIINVFGEPIEIIASSSTTNSAFVIGLQCSPPGGGPPPHRHLGEEEVFTVIDGEFEFFNGESWVPFRRGEVKYSLRGSYHGFRNVNQSAGEKDVHNKWRRVGRVPRRDFVASIAGRHGTSSGDQQILSVRVPSAEKMTTSSGS